MSDFALGVITPFAAIAGLALALALAYLLASLARKAWLSVHNSLIYSLQLHQPKQVYALFDDEEDARLALRDRIRRANRIRDALLESSGKLRIVNGLGFTLLIARTYSTKTEAKVSSRG